MSPHRKHQHYLATKTRSAIKTLAALVGAFGQVGQKRLLPQPWSRPAGNVSGRSAISLDRHADLAQKKDGVED